MLTLSISDVNKALLLRLNPGAAKLFNKSKYLPIHYAAGNGAPPECVALIWHAHPAGAEQRHGKGENALELATQQNRTENMALLQDPERMKAMAAELESHTIGRANQPEDIAALAVFLASPGARNITGQSYNVDGGLITS